MAKMRFAGISEKLRGIIRIKKYKTLSVLIVILCALFMAVAAERVYSNVLTSTQLASSFSLMAVYRAGLLFCGFLFLLIHFIVKIPVFYNVVFKYRYALAVSVFLILVIGKIHFSSIGLYDDTIQPGYGSEFVSTIFGTRRHIRSDEWVVGTPTQLAAQFGPEPFGRFNYILRGTATENMPSGMNIGLATLAFPLHLFFIFGTEYGISARWVGTLIMTFLVAFELIYIISKRNRLLAATGACLITFSPFFQWWSYVFFITAGMGTLVCLYYFITSEKRVKRLLFAIGIVVFFSQFVLSFYPAWQVPAGYLYLALAIWMIVENRERIKKLDKLDWGIMGLAVLLISAVIATYIWESREYISVISNTVYPGTRHNSGGGEELVYIFNRWMNGGVFAPISGFKAFKYYPYKNASEFGGFFTLFPLPIIFVSYVMIKKRIFDLLSTILIAFSLVIGTYVFIGWPEWLARTTLMSYSTTARTMDIVLFAQVLVLICATSRFSVKTEENSNLIKKSIMTVAVVIGLCMVYIAVRFSKSTFMEPINPLFFIIAFAGFILMAYCILDYQRNQKIYKAACLYLIGLSCITWITIHPVMKGLDAIYSKPLSAKVTELAIDTNEKWVAVSCEESVLLGKAFESSAFLVASGAPTINSTNTYPNLELWNKLDSNNKYELIYNRYAHISVILTAEETKFELLHHDWILLHLSYDDLAVAGVKYIYSQHTLHDNEFIQFILLYDEGDSLIYTVRY